jgi:hypothetical protein
MRDTLHGLRARASWTAIAMPRRRRGAIAIMLAIMLPVIIGFVGLALELGQLYNRKAEMQSLADAAAISAAKKLDGTTAGVNEALAAAHGSVEGGADWTMQRYAYRQPVTFDNAALKFGKSGDGSTGWVDADAAKAAPAGVSYVKVDTAALGAGYGTVNLFFMRILSSMTSMEVAHTAVAGRQRLNITPLGICAMHTDPANPIKERVNPGGYSELTEYGFRRGVSYNLLKLNPNGSTPVHYLVDPISLPPKGNATNFSTVNAGAYVCTGTVELPKVLGQTVNLRDGFPIATFYNHLNARFDASGGQCNASSAPPDANIRPYGFGSLSWMGKPDDQVAAPATSATRLETIADLAPPNPQLATSYGPLWVYARPVPWSAYTAGSAEPPQGYAPFAALKDVWDNMYKNGPVLNTYPGGPTGLSSPYFTQVTTPTTHPPGLKSWRVLNVPLLECPVVGGTATVLAIGRFFMTVRADASGIYAEFAGVAPREESAGQVELYQ